MGTTLEEGIAVPHVQLEGLKESVVTVGQSTLGIEWNSVDAKPADLIFLILTPTGQSAQQLHILCTIAMAMRNPTNRQALLDAENKEGIWNVLRMILCEA